MQHRDPGALDDHYQLARTITGDAFRPHLDQNDSSTVGQTVFTLQLPLLGSSGPRWTPALGAKGTDRMTH